MVRILIIMYFFGLLRTVSSKEKTCSTIGPLGMENGNIKDNQITASSFYNNTGEYYPPKDARLRHTHFWATSTPKPSNPWIQVDFLDTRSEVGVTGIQTQGSSLDMPMYQNWVSKLRIQTGDSEQSLTYIMDGNEPKVFDANRDRDTITTIEFPEQIRAKYLRILPTEWMEWVVLRFEVLGCRIDAVCITKGPLGMENGFIKDTQINASDYYFLDKLDLPPKYGRLNNINYWATSTANPTDPWIQVDFLDTGNEVSITGIQTQGSSLETFQEWVSKLRIQTGLSEESLTYIMEGSQPKTFDANSDRDSIATIEFSTAIRTRYLRILPTEWNKWVSLRFEVIGCQTEIPLLQDRTSQSSTWLHRPWSRPASSDRAVDGNTDGAFWHGFCTHTETNDTNAWWKVDMIESQCVGRVVIYNRVDTCCGERLTNATIRVGEDDDLKNNPVFGRVSTAGNIIQLTNDLRGRFISVHVQNNILTICEIKAYHGICSVKIQSTPMTTLANNRANTSSFPRTRTDLYTGAIVGAAVGSSIVVILIMIIAIPCILKLRPQNGAETGDNNTISVSKDENTSSSEYLDLNPTSRMKDAEYQGIYTNPIGDDAANPYSEYQEISDIQTA